MEELSGFAKRSQVLTQMQFQQPRLQDEVNHQQRYLAARNLSLHKLLTDIDNSLEAPALLLKGGHYLFDLYKDNWGKRQISDLDILLKPRQLHCLSEQLKRHGWQSLPAYPTYLYNPTAGSPGIPLDLHTSFVCDSRLSSRRSLLSPSTEESLLSAMTPVSGFKHLHIPSPIPSAIIMLTHHLLHHDFKGWKWWVDFHLWWQQHSVHSEELWATTPELLRPIVAFGLWYYHQLCGCRPNPKMQKRINDHQRWFWLPHLNNFLAGQGLGGSRYLIAFALLKERQWPYYLKEALFPPRDALRQFHFSHQVNTKKNLYLQHWRCLSRSCLTGFRRMYLNS